MAANYAFQSVKNTTELLGGQTSVPVQEFGYVTLPSNIYFQFRRPTAKVTKALVASVADQLATRIEAVFASPNVQGLLYSQTTNASGQLVDVFTIYWASDDGTITGHFDQPMASLGPGNTPPLVAAALAAAEDIAAG